jgi:hypothetical protein
MIGDSFQHRRHLGYGHHEAQIAGRRLTQRKDLYALPINLDFQLIDFVVVIQYFSREDAVSLSQGAHGSNQRGFGFAAQAQNVNPQRVQFFVKMPVHFHYFLIPNQPKRPVM